MYVGKNFFSDSLLVSLENFLILIITVFLGILSALDENVGFFIFGGWKVLGYSGH